MVETARETPLGKLVLGEMGKKAALIGTGKGAMPLAPVHRDTAISARGSHVLSTSHGGDRLLKKLYSKEEV